MPTYEFGCAACGANTERRVGYDVSVVPCPSCGLTAVRRSVYRVNYTGFTPTPLNQKTYYQEFKDFQEAMGFVNRVAAVAEAEGHHPDIRVSYNHVSIELWTHAVKGLSENDFILASKVDLL